MHKTKAGERRKTLKRESLELARDAKVLQKAAKTLPEAGHEAQRLQEDADKALEESEVLKLQARLEDLTVWEMEKTKSTKKGTKTYTYWMVSWREGEKVRNVHLGSSRKMDAEAAKQKARKMKAEALGRSQ
jgi:regulator of replication initiation timing